MIVMHVTQQRLSLRAVKLPSGASPDIGPAAQRCGHFVPWPRLRVCSWQTLLGLIVANVVRHADYRCVRVKTSDIQNKDIINRRGYYSFRFQED